MSEMSDDRYLVSYIPEINKKSCKNLNISLSKVRNILDIDLIEDVKVGYPSVSVAISAAVTAYGIIHMSNIKEKITILGGKFYY